MDWLVKSLYTSPFSESFHSVRISQGYQPRAFTGTRMIQLERKYRFWHLRVIWERFTDALKRITLLALSCLRNYFWTSENRRFFYGHSPLLADFRHSGGFGLDSCRGAQDCA